MGNGVSVDQLLILANEHRSPNVLMDDGRWDCRRHRLDTTSLRQIGRPRPIRIDHGARARSARSVRTAVGAQSAEEFFLLFQPTFELENRSITGVEALIRWRHPADGVVTPDTFIPVLEASGMIVDVGRWVLREACGQAARWASIGWPIDMAVNLSARQHVSTTTSRWWTMFATRWQRRASTAEH